jgi:hypothetical protein
LKNNKNLRSKEAGVMRELSLRIWKWVLLLSIFCLLTSAPLYAEVLTQQSLMYSTPDEAPKTLYFDGKPGIAFYDPKGWLKLMWLDDKTPKAISLQAHPDVKNSYIGFYTSDGKIYLIWRPKLASGDNMGDKHILFSASYDGGKTFTTPRQLDSGNGAFHPRRLGIGANGLLHVVWADERAGAYRIYMNRSTDFGKTWLKEDVRLNQGDKNAYEPFIEAFGKFVWVGWHDPSGVGSTLKMRRSEDGGETWSEEMSIPVPETNILTPDMVKTRVFTPDMVRTGAGIFVFYYADEKGIMYSLSKDNGKTWESPALLPGSKDVGSSGFKTAKNSKGDVCLMWPGPFKLGGQKADIFVSCSNDGGMTWAKEVTRLDTNTPRLTHSLAPDITMDEEGRVVVVWQDLRNIRPNIYMNYSLDGGRSWLRSDVMINKPEGKGMSQFPSVAGDGKGRFLIAWQMVSSDSPKREYFLADEEIRFGREKLQCPKLSSDAARNLCLTSVPIQSEKESREALLISRVEEFWKAYVDGNYKKGFGMMDPFFRARGSEQDFVSKVGQLKYLKFEILKDKMIIRENTATVKVKVTFEAETFSVGRFEGSIPKTERELEDTWIWIDGNWFKVYDTGSGNFLPLI